MDDPQRQANAWVMAVAIVGVIAFVLVAIGSVVNADRRSDAERWADELCESLAEARDEPGDVVAALRDALRELARTDPDDVDEYREAVRDSDECRELARDG